MQRDSLLAIALFAVVLACIAVVATAFDFIDKGSLPFILAGLVAMGSAATGTYCAIRRNDEER